MLARRLDIRRRMSTLSLPKSSSLFSTTQLPVPKTLATNSRVSITSKLIEIKGLQVLYSDHLRKIEGRGIYLLVYTMHHPARKSPPLTPVFPPLVRPPLNSCFYSNL